MEQHIKIRKLFKLSLDFNEPIHSCSLIDQNDDLPATQINTSNGGSLTIKIRAVQLTNQVTEELQGVLEYAKKRSVELVNNSIIWRIKFREKSLSIKQRHTSQYYIIANAYEGDSCIGTAQSAFIQLHSKDDNLIQETESIPLFWPESSSSLSDDSMDYNYALATYIDNDYILLSDGNAEVRGNLRALNFYKTSDERFKTNITPIDPGDARRTLLCIDGVQYNFHGGDPTRFAGYLAQQVQKFIPEATKYINGILHVDYTMILPYITQAVKESYGDVQHIQDSNKLLQYYLELLYDQFNEQQKHKAHPRHSLAPSRRQLYIIAASVILLAVIASVFAIVYFQPGPKVDNPASTPSPKESPVAPNCQDRCAKNFKPTKYYNTLNLLTDLQQRWQSCVGSNNFTVGNMIVVAMKVEQNTSESVTVQFQTLSEYQCSWITIEMSISVKLPATTYLMTRFDESKYVVYHVQLETEYLSVPRMLISSDLNMQLFGTVFISFDNNSCIGLLKCDET